MFVQILRKIFHLQSFEINAICYSIPVQDYAQKEYKGNWFTSCGILCSIYGMMANKMNLSQWLETNISLKISQKKLAALKVLEDEVYKINKDLGNI